MSSGYGLEGVRPYTIHHTPSEKHKNQALAKSVALLLGHKLLAVGVFQQVYDVLVYTVYTM